MHESTRLISSGSQTNIIYPQLPRERFPSLDSKSVDEGDIRKARE